MKESKNSQNLYIEMPPPQLISYVQDLSGRTISTSSLLPRRPPFPCHIIMTTLFPSDNKRSKNISLHPCSLSLHGPCTVVLTVHTVYCAAAFFPYNVSQCCVPYSGMYLYSTYSSITPYYSDFHARVLLQTIPHWLVLNLCTLLLLLVGLSKFSISRSTQLMVLVMQSQKHLLCPSSSHRYV